MGNNNVIILSHRRDFDGIASAAEILNEFKVGVDNIIFTNPTTDLFIEALHEIEKYEDCIIYITDLSVADQGIDDITSSLKKIKGKNNKVIWLDHHPWSESSYSKIKDLVDTLIAGENKDFCAAEIVYQKLCKDNDTCKRLAEIAHLTDFNIKPNDKQLNEALVKLSECIAYLDNGDAESNALRSKLVSYVSEGKISGDIVEEIYGKYKISESENIEQLYGTLESFNSGNVKVGIAFADNLQSNMACSLIKDKTAAGIQIFVTTKDWSAHVRSDSDIDSSVISKKLGGNGHKNASGFTITPEGETMESKISDYVKKVKNAAYSTYKNKSSLND